MRNAWWMGLCFCHNWKQSLMVFSCCLSKFRTTLCQFLRKWPIINKGRRVCYSQRMHGMIHKVGNWLATRQRPCLLSLYPQRPGQTPVGWVWLWWKGETNPYYTSMFCPIVCSWILDRKTNFTMTLSLQL